MNMESTTPGSSKSRKKRGSPVEQNQSGKKDVERKVYSKRERKPRTIFEPDEINSTEKVNKDKIGKVKEPKGNKSKSKKVKEPEVYIDQAENVEEENQQESSDNLHFSESDLDDKVKSLTTAVEEKRKINNKSRSNSPQLCEKDEIIEETVESSQTYVENVKLSAETNECGKITKDEKNDNGEVADVEYVDTSPGDTNKTPSDTKVTKRRGRTPRSASNTPAKGSQSSARKSAPDCKSDVSSETPRRGRKRKTVDYAAINAGSQENDNEDEQADVGEMHVSARKKKKEKNVDDTVLDDEMETEKTPSTKTPGSGRKSAKKIVEWKCPKCEKIFSSLSLLQKHAAVEHQIWVTSENPEGDGIERASLRQIMKYKKFLNCIKCDKRINFLHYYYHHVEWCGRENELYTCEHCNRPNLKAIWRHHHLLQCVGLVKPEPDQKPDKQEEEVEEEEVDPNIPRKRKAAKKALSMVHNLSKDGDKDETSKTDAKDSDVEMDVDVDDEDDDDEYDDDDEDIDDDLGSGDEGEAELLDDEKGTKGKPFFKIPNNTFGRHYSKYLPTYKMMQKYSEERKTDVSFPDLLPRKEDWVLLDEEESTKYLPRRKSSNFKMDGKNKEFNLQFPYSAEVDGSPIFYTGLCVWRLAWCPQPFGCKDDQYLAIVGKLEKSDHFVTTKHGGPGVIQIWNCGKMTIKADGYKSLPRLWYCIGHEFGQATEIKWCSTGCYKTNNDQNDDDNHTRLGLLACSFTDGTVRVFSLPLLPTTSNGEVRVYKTSPVITLYRHHDIDNIDVSCSCMDWQENNKHRKMMAGYSDGTVRLFNLDVNNKRLLLKSDNIDGRCILPFKTIHAHGKVIRTVRWMSSDEDIILTACENSETNMWHLSNTKIPIVTDSNYVHMVTCSDSSLWHPGIFLGSDDNYALGCNRSRYLEGGSFSFYLYRLPVERKDEHVNFNFAAQPACVWDVSFSNWMCYVLACDNRGTLGGFPMHDPLKHMMDTKCYKNRQVLFTTQEKIVPKEIKEEPHSDGHDDQSGNVSQNIDQSGDLLQRRNDKLAATESTQQNVDKTDETDEKAMNGEETTAEDSNDRFYVFKEYFKKPLKVKFDKNNDDYMTNKEKALKAVHFNPNHLQCTWIAFGGDVGLVRLANITNCIPNEGRSLLPS